MTRLFTRVGDLPVLEEEHTRGTGRLLMVRGSIERVRRLSDWRPGDGGPDELFAR